MKEALIQICARLNKHGADYMLIGGMAVFYHGYSRTTADVDFWYKPTLENFHKIVSALREQAIDVSELEKLVFNPEKASLRFPVGGIKIELLPAIPGDISFGETRARAEISGTWRCQNLCHRI